jgi:hypothetical protein
VFYIEGIPIQEDCGTCEGTGELAAAIDRWEMNIINREDDYAELKHRKSQTGQWVTFADHQAALRAAPSLSREEWGMLNFIIEQHPKWYNRQEEWEALRAKVREAGTGDEDDL